LIILFEIKVFFKDLNMKKQALEVHQFADFFTDFLQKKRDFLKKTLTTFLETGNPSDINDQISALSQNNQYDLARAFLNHHVLPMNRIIEKYDGILIEELIQIYNHAYCPNRYKISDEDIQTVRQLPVESLALLRDVDRLVSTIPYIQQMYNAQRPFLDSESALKIQASRHVFTTLDPEKQEAVRAILLAFDDNFLSTPPSLRELPYGSPLAKALSPERDLLQEVTNKVLESCSNALQGLRGLLGGVMHNNNPRQ
jgi:hypothetical protein